MKAEVKFQVRLPTEVRDALETDARNSHRSMNRQIISILRERFRAIGLLADAQDEDVHEGTRKGRS
jgi:hypothetical protein